MSQKTKEVKIPQQKDKIESLDKFVSSMNSLKFDPEKHLSEYGKDVIAALRESME